MISRLGLSRIRADAANAWHARVSSLRRRFDEWRELASKIRRTLFIRHLDNQAEILVSSVFVDAGNRGLNAVCIFHSYIPPSESIRELLANPKVSSVGLKDSRFDSLMPADLQEDPRVGRYWEPGGWSLPAAATDVYFVGPWRLLTAAMFREATSRGVRSLRVRVAIYWITVPLSVFRTAQRLWYPCNVLFRAFRGWWSYCLGAAAGFWRKRPRVTTPRVKILSPEAALEGMLRTNYPSVGAVPGRIVHVCGNLQPGGAERQLVYTLEGLQKRKFESVRLLCHSLRADSGDRSDFHLERVRAAGIEVREIRRHVTVATMPSNIREAVNSLPGGLLNDIADLFWEFIELRPQVVHAWLDWDNVRSGIAAVLAGVPNVVLSGRNINPSHFALYQAYMDPAYRVLMRRSNVTLINNSRAGANDYADWIGIARHRVPVIYNGVDLGGARLDSDASANSLRERLKIPREVFLVGGVFRLESEKRPLLWIEVAAIVAAHIPNAWFVIFGQGSLREQIIEAAKRHGVAERLVMPGLIGDVSPAMAMCDVLLLTSFGEGLPNVLLEAQWNGTPVVTTDVGGAAEAIQPDVTGWAVSSDGAQDLAQQIIRLYDDPKVRETARIEGPKFVRHRFSVERMISETARLYEVAASD
ncbi:glycosyltransferase [Bradyrhizobium brasilense]|nr:glycosyltransferase [Bradyrhizobium brasilense]